MNISGELEVKFPEDLLSAVRDTGSIADHRNQKAVLVGGVVRDLILGKSVVDADLMIEPPVAPIVESLAKKRNGKVVFHERFQTFTIHFGTDRRLDVVTAREERYPTPAALPVVVPSTIEADLKRRDFSVNAIACWINTGKFGEVLDPFGGTKDLDLGIIRALHSKSFIDDPTRIFRAARFAGRLGFQLDPETESWIMESISQGIPGRLSPARRRHEFELLLKEEDPRRALFLLVAWGALSCLHSDWTGLPPSVPFMTSDEARAAESSHELLVRRLALWFGGASLDSVRDLMTELGFLKSVKKDVLDILTKNKRIGPIASE